MTDPLSPDEIAEMRKLLAERQAWGILWRLMIWAGGAFIAVGGFTVAIYSAAHTK